MIELPENFDSVFRYIVVVSQRAEQLINGAKPRMDSRHEKPTLEAVDDVNAGLVPWRVLTQAEIDAQRQAIVDQFRAEVACEGFDPEQARAIPDVLPTASEAEDEGEEEVAPAEAEDRDDELARLQRLLGMAGGKKAAAEDLENLDEDVDLDDVDEDEDESDDEDDSDEEGEDYYLDVDDGDGDFNDDD
jgi:DNA-directed RNA polymerase subunit K/omega